MFFVNYQSQAVSRPSISVAMFARVGEAVEVLAGGEIRGKKGRVLVPGGMLEVIFGSGRAVHGDDRLVV